MAQKGDRPRVVGKGTIQYRGNGTWRVRHNMGKDPVTGKYLYSPFRTIHTTSKREAQAFAEEYKRELNEGMAPKPNRRLTLSGYLDTYHSGREGVVALSTFEREGTIVRKTKELVGVVNLQDVDASFLNERFTYARANRLMSESDLLRVHTLLNGAFKRARREGLVRENPMELVDRPRPRNKRRDALTAEEARRFKEALLAQSVSAKVVACMIMLETGCRRGEALGLTWDRAHLDGERPYLVIDRQLTKELQLSPPKSETGNRVVSISGEFAGYLKRWKSVQAKELEEKRLAQEEDTFIVHAFQVVKPEDENGNAIRYLNAGFQDPHNFNRWFKDFCVDHGFGDYTQNVTEKKYAGRTIRRGSGYVGLTPHGLRHTQATLLIGNGVDVKTVQARLGHSDPSLTLRQYSHAIRENDARAAILFESLLPTGQEG